MKKIESEAQLTFSEATGIIIGHGVGSGILSVPYLASRNSIFDVLWIIALVYAVNLLMHLMIAELSYNNGGAQFITCISGELPNGRFRKIITWVAFGLLGLSVLVNVCGFITGGAAVFVSWFAVPEWCAKLIYYVIASVVVLFGMKIVGICEKLSVYAMLAVMAILLVATLIGETLPLPNSFIAPTNLIALYSMVAFSLSAVMSVPTVVKGLNDNPKRIRASIAAGTGVNVFLILIITLITMLCCGNNVSEQGALVDIAGKLGGWVGIIGYIFSLLALSTSFWANTLNLRDIIHEQTGWGIRPSFLAASLPCLVLAMFGLQSFVGFTRVASVIQVVTGIGIIVAYSRSRKREGASVICGSFGRLPFRIIVVLSSILATAGALFKVV